MTGSTNDSNESSDLPRLARHVEGPERTLEPSPKYRRRFSQDTINDLLFWGAHLCIVAISLAVVWYKIDKTNLALKTLLDAQSQETAIVRRQLLAVEEQTALAKAQEQERAEQVKQNQQALGLMLTSMTRIQADIRKNLEETQGITVTILDVSNQAKVASLQAASAGAMAANAANSAANAAGTAASAASSAAARSSATRTLIREKVVTSDDKVRIEQEQRALAAKKAQLSKTIRQVKKKGPTLLQQIFH